LSFSQVSYLKKQKNKMFSSCFKTPNEPESPETVSKVSEPTGSGAGHNFETSLRPPKNKIFMVCTSNTCRSPMAEGIARQVIQKNNLPIEVGSFGVWASDGRKPTRHGVEICAEDGIDISNQRSTAIESVDFDSLDNAKVVCMSQWHAKGVKEFAQENRLKILKPGTIFLLNPWGDIYDPVCSPRERYVEVYETIKPLVEKHVLEFARELKKEEN